MVVLVVGLVAIVASAAIFNQSRTPRGQIVMPATLPRSSPTPESTTDTSAVPATVPVQPALFVPAEVAAPTAERSAVVRGLIDGIASVTVNGQPVAVEPGAFTAEIAFGTAEAKVVATGLDGSTVEATVAMGADRVPPGPETVAVHVALEDMSDLQLWLPILAMAQEGRINAVQLDIKDETGQVGYTSGVALATTVGAVGPRYNPADIIAQLHALNVKVIGRVVCFLDPKLGGWAWGAGQRDMVVQHSDGTPLNNDYGTASFSNVAHPVVRKYLWDLTAEAIGFGFDDILYDYVRRPEGDSTAMLFAGLETSPSVAVARFVRDTAQVIKATKPGVRFGVSVFGIAATRPDQIGQDVRLIAPHVDYVAPMLYPALWGDGEYGVEKPWRTPGQIVERSLVDFHRVLAGSGAALTPWLQDFDAGRFAYGEPQVREQVDAARWSGTSGFLIWNPASTYDFLALDPRLSTVDTAEIPPQEASAPDVPDAPDSPDGSAPPSS